MKVKLTEDQFKKIVKFINEDVESDISSEFAKQAPNLTKLGGFLSLLGSQQKAQEREQLQKYLQQYGQQYSQEPVDLSTYNTDNPSDVEIPQQNYWDKKSQDAPTSKGLIHPLGRRVRLGDKFGPRVQPKPGASKFHKGVDIPIRSGSPVYAPTHGVVVFAGDTSKLPTGGGCGGHIRLDHKTIQTKFCHLRSWTVKRGDIVKQGQIIGYTGGGPNDPYAGTSTGPHLHYEIVNPSGIAMDPLKVQPNLS